MSLERKKSAVKQCLVKSSYRRLTAVCTMAITLAIGAYAEEPSHHRVPRRQQTEIKPPELSRLAPTASSNPNTAQGPGPGPIGPGPGCNVFPAPASVGATVDLSYFGPPPSTRQSQLGGSGAIAKYRPD